VPGRRAQRAAAAVVRGDPGNMRKKLETEAGAAALPEGKRTAGAMKPAGAGGREAGERDRRRAAPRSGSEGRSSPRTGEPREWSQRGKGKGGKGKGNAKAKASAVNGGSAKAESDVTDDVEQEEVPGADEAPHVGGAKRSSESGKSFVVRACRQRVSESPGMYKEERREKGPPQGRSRGERRRADCGIWYAARGKRLSALPLLQAAIRLKAKGALF